MWRNVGLVGAIGVCVAIVWWKNQPVEVAPPSDAEVVGASQLLRWREGAVQSYRLDLDSLVEVGGGPAGPADPIHQEVRGVLNLRTLGVAVDEVTVGLQFGPVEMRVAGVGDDSFAAALGAPFRVVFDPAGLPRRFEFAADVALRHRALLEEIVRTFQVVVRDGLVWNAEETHGSGRYEAVYERGNGPQGQQIRRRKQRYLPPAAGGPPPVAVRQALAIVRLDPHVDWLAGMTVEETLAAHDDSGMSFVVTTHGSLELQPTTANVVPSTVDWSFAAAVVDDGTWPRGAPLSELPAEELAATLATILDSLDAATEGRTAFVHRLRDLLRADRRAAALLLARMQAQPFRDRTRADLFLALELAATPEAQTGLVQVAQGAMWAARDRTRALVALGGLEQPSRATVDALWISVRTRNDAATNELANTALLALGALGSRLLSADEAAYRDLRDGLLAEAHGAPGPGESAAALLALANTGDRGLAKELAPFLDAPASDVRRAAAKAVGRLGGEVELVELAQRLPHEPNSAVRAAMAASCAAYPTPTPGLLAMAREQVGREPDEAARLDLARCLGRHLAAHADNENALRTMFAAETSPTIRRYVGEVLGRATEAAAAVSGPTGR